MGLFDRLFRQEKTDSQETLANKELTEVISEMDSIADQDLSSSELTTGIKQDSLARLILK